MSMRKQLESFLEMGALTIALVYFCLSLVWIYFSNNLVEIISNGNTDTFLFLETIKGFGFISISTILLYFAIDYYLHKNN